MKKLTIILFLLFVGSYGFGQSYEKLRVVDSLMSSNNYIQAIIVAKDIKKFEDTYDRIMRNYYISNSYIKLNQIKKAHKYANKVFKIPFLFAGRGDLYKTLLASEIASYYEEHEE